MQCGIERAQIACASVVDALDLGAAAEHWVVLGIPLICISELLEGC